LKAQALESGRPGGTLLLSLGGPTLLDNA
jgi:hypothetical protein